LKLIGNKFWTRRTNNLELNADKKYLGFTQCVIPQQIQCAFPFFHGQ